MRRFNLIILSLLLVILAFTTSTASAATASTSKINASKNNKALRLRDNYDIIISGAGMGGLSAGIQAARMGASVLIIEPSSLIGGQAIAAGVSTMDSFTDFNNSGFNSGIYLEFINKVKFIMTHGASPWEHAIGTLAASHSNRILAAKLC
nr:FAD-dependent oxidoreductase [Synergistaceae bacterium]